MERGAEQSFYYISERIIFSESLRCLNDSPYSKQGLLSLATTSFMFIMPFTLSQFLYQPFQYPCDQDEMFISQQAIAVFCRLGLARKKNVDLDFSRFDSSWNEDITPALRRSVLFFAWRRAIYVRLRGFGIFASHTVNPRVSPHLRTNFDK